MNRMIIFFFISIFANAQDPEEYTQTEYQQLQVQYELLTTEMAGVKADLERAYRPHAKNLLERILLQRFMAPVDLWIMSPAIAKEPFPTRGVTYEGKHDPHWYVLIIEPENKLANPKIWVKFEVDFLEYIQDTKAQVMEQYMVHKRDSLLEVLELQLVTMLDDPSAIQTMIDGIPHLYRLATRDTDIEKLRKEDRIY